MKIVLFEDNQCFNLRPAGLFRPLFDLYAGSWTLYKLVKLLDYPIDVIIREHFLFEDQGHSWLKSPLQEPHLFLNSSIEPDVNYLTEFGNISKSADPFITTSGNRVAAALVPSGREFPQSVTSNDIGSILLEMDLPLIHHKFKTIDWPHEIVESHLRLFDSSLEKILSCGNFDRKKKDVYIGENVELDSSTKFDTSEGPVVLENGVKVKPFTFFEGPVYIGPNTRIIEHASIKDKTSIGEMCKIGGEIEMSVVEPHSNKQHHGFLGHSWVGRWVNLGAGTTTSDLKNTYGKVRVVYGGKRVGTGMQFLGSIIGDFTKTAINSSLFTGKMIGVCSMIYGMVTTNVPSFSNYARTFGQVTEISPEQVVTTQRRTFERRNIKQSQRDIELVHRVYKLTRNERGIGAEQITF
ncbi:MAG: glucose-1-phosphate thymidylyltransferase [Candidatus Latescibacteria bacterium]|nr:glucose-1-phosphate thymidylyltransferase [Candidatus Latescibacterota bacterium]